MGFLNLYSYFRDDFYGLFKNIFKIIVVSDIFYVK